MQTIKDKLKYLFLHFLSPKEIIFIFLLLFLSFFFFLNFLYKGSTYVMTERIMFVGNATEGVIGSLKDTNPYQTDNQTDKDLSHLLYSSLIKNLDGGKFELGLAEKVETNTDQSVYKVTIRSGLSFSNGTPITVDDILYSLGKVPVEKTFSVEKSTENVLIFTLKEDSGKISQARANLLTTLAYPIVSKNETFEGNYSTNLVTSGFFKLDSIEKDSDGNVTRVNLQRFDNGEPKLPYLKTYSIIYYKDEVTAYTAFQKKEIDILSGIPGTTISKIIDDQNIKYHATPETSNFAIFLNQNDNEALRDPSLRRGLSDIIDRESLTNQVLGGFGIPEKNILGEKGVVKTKEEVINSLGSSFSFKDGVLYVSTEKTKNTNLGTPVKIKITTIKNQELEDTVKFIAQSWKKIGIETDIQIIDHKDLSEVVKTRNFEALLFGYSIKNPRDYYSFFSSKERVYPKLNISNYTSKQVDKILDVLVGESGQARIDDLTNQLSVEVAEDNPIIILYKPKFVFIHFLPLQITLPNIIKNEDDRYAYIASWYSETEKVLKIFKQSSLIDKLDILLY